MPNRSWKGMTVKLDNAAGTLTDLTQWCNSVNPKGTMALIDDTSLADEEVSNMAGLASATIAANFFSNSTTDAIFAPLVGNRTTATKTARIYTGGNWSAGEVFPTDVGWSGSPGSLVLWSTTLTFDGACSNTTT